MRPRKTNHRKSKPRKAKPLRSRRWRWTKWTGLVLCFLLMVVWIGSGWFIAAFKSSSVPQRTFYVVSIWSGNVVAEAMMYRGSYDDEGYLDSQYMGEWQIDLWSFEAFWRPDLSQYRIIFPLWLPLLLIAAPTGWLWWRDRASRWKNRCPNPRCRYLLTGLTSPKCPECGTEVSPPNVSQKP